MIYKYKKIIRHIQTEYQKSNLTWYLGYSGGKDSSALLKLVYVAVKGIKNPKRNIVVVYCDTGVEIPVVRDFAYKTLRDISKEACKDNIPLKTQVAQPKLTDRYFVKVLGYGYPTPTNKFRWCTDRLRVNPINTITKDANGKISVVLLGTRKGESLERNKILEKYKTRRSYYFEQSNTKKTLIYSPIVNCDVNDIWHILKAKCPPYSIKYNRLSLLYNAYDKNSRDEKNYKSRFGCWMCTVIRKDRAMERLIQHGYGDLKPLLSFRNWVLKIRDNPKYRFPNRRNGAKGMGPFTLKARKEMLCNLQETQKNVPWTLIGREEIALIRRIWKSEFKEK